jgi:hypothetical protein
MNPELPVHISSIQEAKNGIRRFQTELENGTNLGHLLSSFHAWYAIKDESGNVLYGPSKFIGYSDLTDDLYRQVSRETDGRVTEAVLSRLGFSQPTKDCELKLIEGLSKFLNTYGKQPNKRVRVSTIGGAPLEEGAIEGDVGHGPSVVDAFLVIFRSLSDGDQKELRRRINKDF